MSIVITPKHKGICLIALGIVMRDSGCTAVEVGEEYPERYVKLIEKKGSGLGITKDEAESLSHLSIDELVS
ncbi:hypothetical protein Vid5_gp37 [Pantoea phage vB_PagS_Vid5]|uniref:Uncharacterized protein n=1 Tax=Pantoea phage vB_PagS_Vid5 TaxID=2099652 RepID=A0A2P1CKS4_9CAUD|nr:hypothetical protein FDJ45_gp037 [Pantoea phage vB_PagS_Vid5]AVJ51792.1 hypothetical protein Vid5_gp37 [Pantoea phage vB_PagS_Vid5]